MRLELGHKLKPFYPELQIDSVAAKSSLGAWIALDGFSRGYRDYSGKGNHAIFQGTFAPVLGASPSGPAWPIAGAGYAQTAGVSLNGTQGTIAVYARFPTAYSGLQAFAGNSVSTTGQTLRFAINPSRQLRLDVGTVAFFAPAVSSTLDGTWATILARWDGATQEIWVNGAIQGTNTATTSLTPPTGDFFTIGAVNTGGTVVYSGLIGDVFLDSQRWTDSQCRTFSADPWADFRPQVYRGLNFGPATAAVTRFRRKSTPSRVGSRSAA